MKTKLLIRAFMLPLVGCVLTSCETSGQLLAGGVCACVVFITCAVGGIVTGSSRAFRAKA